MEGSWGIWAVLWGSGLPLPREHGRGDVPTCWPFPCVVSAQCSFHPNSRGRLDLLDAGEPWGAGRPAAELSGSQGGVGRARAWDQV